MQSMTSPYFILFLSCREQFPQSGLVKVNKPQYTPTTSSTHTSARICRIQGPQTRTTCRHKPPHAQSQQALHIGVGKCTRPTPSFTRFTLKARAVAGHTAAHCASETPLQHQTKRTHVWFGAATSGTHTTTTSGTHTSRLRCRAYALNVHDLHAVTTITSCLIALYRVIDWYLILSGTKGVLPYLWRLMLSRACT